MKNSKFKIQNFLSVLGILAALYGAASAQEKPPTPGAPKTVSIPAVKEKKLANGLTIAVVERKNVPLVSVQMMFGSGVTSEDLETAGLANMTANLLTKGTKTRSATQIAEQMEFLGSGIFTGAGLDDSNVTISVTSDKIDKAMTILSDVILHPSFPDKEIELAKSQSLDNLNNNLQQPGFLSSYVASVYSFYGNPASGTPKSINAMNRKTISDFYRENYYPENATLIFVGDITAARAFAIAQKLFGAWKNPKKEKSDTPAMMITETVGSFENRKQAEAQQPIVKRMLVIDLPDAGQASVAFTKSAQFAGRITYNDEKKRGETSESYFPAIVMNSIFGGGYSSRLNQEVRIKRGLSYGAGSSFNWRAYDSRFSTRTQTKNESAAEVAELVVEEIEKLGKSNISENEITSRKAVLTGDFGRDLETNFGLLGAVADLYSNLLPASELNSYMNSVRSVTDTQVKQFARENLRGGDVIIVGDYAKFKDDLKRRFPNMRIEIIKAADLDLKNFSQE